MSFGNVKVKCSEDDGDAFKVHSANFGCLQLGWVASSLLAIMPRAVTSGLSCSGRNRSSGAAFLTSSLASCQGYEKMYIMVISMVYIITT